MFWMVRWFAVVVSWLYLGSQIIIIIKKRTQIPYLPEWAVEFPTGVGTGNISKL